MNGLMFTYRFVPDGTFRVEAWKDDTRYEPEDWTGSWTEKRGVITIKDNLGNPTRNRWKVVDGKLHISRWYEFNGWVKQLPFEPTE